MSTTEAIRRLLDETHYHTERADRHLDSDQAEQDDLRAGSVSTPAGRRRTYDRERQIHPYSPIG